MLDLLRVYEGMFSIVFGVKSDMRKIFFHLLEWAYKYWDSIENS